MGKVFLKREKSYLKKNKLAIILLIFFFLVYSYGLSLSPVHLNQDELMFSLNAKAISETLNDYYGNRLPFYFWHLDGFWATPVITYFSAMVLKFTPFSVSSVRLTSVFIGLINIALTMVLAQMIFKKRSVTLLSGLLMATTPVHFIHSRLLLDNLYIVPFVLGWLIFIKKYFDKGKSSFLFFAGLSLGIGLHSYHAAKIYMPIFLGLTLTLLFWTERKNFIKKISFVLLGFIIPIILFLPWLVKHPDTLTNQVSYISSIDKTIEKSKGFVGIINKARLGRISQSYLSYFSPRILFTSGDRSLIHSTREVGAFLFPLFFFVPFGLLNIFKRKDPFSNLILLGLIFYPLAPSLINDPERISRALIVIPFMILLFTYGVSFLLERKKKDDTLLVKAIVVASFIQFIFFFISYFGVYRENSYKWFNKNIGGTFEAISKSENYRDSRQVYLDSNIPFVTYYVDFYKKAYRMTISDKTKLFDSSLVDFSQFEAMSLVAIMAENVKSRNDHIGNFEKIEVIREPNGNESFYLFWRDE